MKNKNIFNRTFIEVERLSQLYDGVLIGYSGGKDSRVVLDICAKFFKRIACFLMYFVPGISIIEDSIKYAQDRYGVSVLQYPHWSLAYDLREGTYCHPSYRYDAVPFLSPADIFALARADSGINLIALGQKKSDSTFRARNLNPFNPNHKSMNDVVNPIMDWNKFDVLAYCKVHNIPLPDTHAGNVTGISLSYECLTWLYDKHPEDFQVILKYFPLAEVPIYWRKFYGQELNGKTAKKKRSRIQPEKNHQA